MKQWGYIVGLTFLACTTPSSGAEERSDVFENLGGAASYSAGGISRLPDSQIVGAP